jgi:hypothetical protein
MSLGTNPPGTVAFGSIGAGATVLTNPLAEVYFDTGPAAANNSAMFVVVLRVQDGYIYWIGRKEGFGGQRGGFTGTGWYASCPDLPVPAEVSAWSQWRSELRLRVTQEGSDLVVEAFIGYAQCGIGDEGAITVTQSGALRIVNAIASSEPVTGEGALNIWTSPNPVVQVVAPERAYQYFRRLTALTGKRILSCGFDETTPPAELRLFEVPAVYAPYYSPYGPAAMATGTVRLLPSLVTAIWPGRDEGAEYNLPGHHYFDWFEGHPHGESAIPPDYWVADWRSLTSAMDAFADYTGSHHVYYYDKDHAEIKLRLYAADLSSYVESDALSTASAVSLNAFQTAGQRTHLFYLSSGALTHAQSEDGERTFTMAPTGLSGYAEVDVAELPIDSRVLAMLHDGVSGHNWFQSIGTWNPATNEYDSWTTPVDTSLPGDGTRGALERHFDGLLVFTYSDASSVVQVVRCENFKIDGTGTWA